MDHLPQFGSLQRTTDGDRWAGFGERMAAQPPAAKAASLVPAASPPPAAAERRASLARTIELEIIPRLLRAHCTASPERRAEAAQGKAMAAVADFAQRVLEQDTAGALACLHSLRAQGASLDWLCAEVLVPATQRLGSLWQDDLGDFERVSRALWRLQQLPSAGPLFVAAESETTAWRALLVPAAGEAHTLGSGTLAEVLRRAGWDVWGGPTGPNEELCALVASTHFDLVVLSVSCHSRLDLQDETIRAVRRAADGRALGVLVAGPQQVERTAH